MPSQIAASIARRLRADKSREKVHFHADSAGRPFVCDNDRCESPTLAPEEIGLGRR
ncbi:MAG: hypothetical protein ACXVQR_03005 [Solirubrobacteraceae bacterium]